MFLLCQSAVALAGPLNEFPMELDAEELDQIEKAEYKCPFPYDEESATSCTLWQAVGNWLVAFVGLLLMAYVVAFPIICCLTCREPWRPQELSEEETLLLKPESA